MQLNVKGLLLGRFLFIYFTFLDTPQATMPVEKEEFATMEQY